MRAECSAAERGEEDEARGAICKGASGALLTLGVPGYLPDYHNDLDV